MGVKEIRFTGFSRKEFCKRLQQKGKLACCYFCKRGEKDESAFTDGEGGVGFAPIHLSWVELNPEKGLVLRALLCMECHTILGMHPKVQDERGELPSGLAKQSVN